MVGCVANVHAPFKIVHEHHSRERHGRVRRATSAGSLDEYLLPKDARKFVMLLLRGKTTFGGKGWLQLNEGPILKSKK